MWPLLLRVVARRRLRGGFGVPDRESQPRSAAIVIDAKRLPGKCNGQDYPSIVPNEYRFRLAREYGESINRIAYETAQNCQ
jgi:hypothetical protein